MELIKLMKYILSPSTDPYWNLALEQYVFDELDENYGYFMLWQNDNTIVVGKHQNTAGEINAEYVKENDIKVVRRLSGGGAVYHDLGNLNYTFIEDSSDKTIDFSRFCGPVVRALDSLGVKATLSGRNDMEIDGKKFSGNAMYKKHGRVMQHGTLMFDSNIDILTRALKVSKDKIESKGIKSIRSRVTNIKPHTEKDLSITDFIEALRDFMFKENDMETYELTEKDISAVDKLRDEVYSTWEWNYGTSPKYTILKERRFDGVGKIEVYMNIVKGIIEDITFHGDYFCSDDPKNLSQILIGSKLEESEIRDIVSSVDISHFFNKLDAESFISLIFE